MIKKIIINGRTIPVPVPVTTMSQALHWISDTFLTPGKLLTRMLLDGVELEDFNPDLPAYKTATLAETSQLLLTIDTPIELCIQTLEAVRNLATVVSRGLKPIAVDCWNAKPVDKPVESDSVENDIGLILNLIDHFKVIVDRSHMDFAAIQGIAIMLQQGSVALQMARNNSDWRAFARILLNRIEPLIKDLLNESEAVQVRVLGLIGDDSVAKTG